MSFLSVLLGILTFVLILVSLFLVMIVLMQKTKDGGMGAALGGGAAEAAFGADTGNVLSKSTIYAAIAFFVLAFLLYLGRIYERTNGRGGEGALPVITAPAAPATTAPATTGPAGAGVTLPGSATTTPAAAPATTTPAPAPATTTPGTEAPKK
jgi:preprotein translocase subunit SecG